MLKLKGCFPSSESYPTLVRGIIMSFFFSKKNKKKVFKS